MWIDQRIDAYCATIEGLRGGFMFVIQASNDCELTGKSCAGGECACALEMGYWVNAYVDTQEAAKVHSLAVEATPPS